MHQGLGQERTQHIQEVGKGQCGRDDNQGRKRWSCAQRGGSQFIYLLSGYLDWITIFQWNNPVGQEEGGRVSRCWVDATPGNMKLAYASHSGDFHLKHSFLCVHSEGRLKLFKGWKLMKYEETMCCETVRSPAFQWTGNRWGTTVGLKPFPGSWAWCLQRRIVSCV